MMKHFTGGTLISCLQAQTLEFECLGLDTVLPLTASPSKEEKDSQPTP